MGGSGDSLCALKAYLGCVDEATCSFAWVALGGLGGGEGEEIAVLQIPFPSWGKPLLILLLWLFQAQL